MHLYIMIKHIKYTTAEEGGVTTLVTPPLATRL